MLYKTEYILLAIILFIVLGICLISPVQYTPYMANNLFANTTKYEGFTGLEGDAAATEPSIDIYANLKGDKSCPPNPYSNSMGYLCIGDSGLPYDMLMTRGGNQTRA